MGRQTRKSSGAPAATAATAPAAPAATSGQPTGAGAGGLPDTALSEGTEKNGEFAPEIEIAASGASAAPAAALPADLATAPVPPIATDATSLSAADLAGAEIVGFKVAPANDGADGGLVGIDLPADGIARNFELRAWPYAAGSVLDTHAVGVSDLPPEPKLPARRFKALSNILHDGVETLAGGSLYLFRDSFEPLKAAGAVAGDWDDDDD